MRKTEGKINTSQLKKEAKSNELSEAYETICRDKDYRIGAGARMNDPKELIFFLEVVIPLSEEDVELKMEELKEKVGLLEEFEDLGYNLSSEKDSSVICEKKVPESELEDEFNTLEGLLENER